MKKTKRLKMKKTISFGFGKSTSNISDRIIYFIGLFAISLGYLVSREIILLIVFIYVILLIVIPDFKIYVITKK